MGNGLVVAIVYGTICVLVLVLAWMIFMRPEKEEVEKFPPRLADLQKAAQRKESA